jgi:hypothetical protein
MKCCLTIFASQQAVLGIVLPLGGLQALVLVGPFSPWPLP